MPRVKSKLAVRPRRGYLLTAWMRSPLKVGALVPSSKALARAMTAPLNLAREGMVIELGGGTGAVTEALLHAGLEPERLLVIERDTRLHHILSSRFPQLNVVCADAAHLEHTLAVQGVARVNAVISSLPLLSMPKYARRIVAQAMLEAIGDGVLVQFTYGPRSPIGHEMLKRRNLKGRRVKTVLVNIPPAHVWVYHKERRLKPR